MTPVRALIVDDSLVMRGLFGGILERTRGIDVVGVAANADEAREMMIRLKPSVVTLDVEMPGMGGLEFLEEIMRDRPTPVVMLSSQTGKGAEASFRALELGAVDCFCKPQRADPTEFQALSAKLSALVMAASAAGVRRPRQRRAKAVATPYAWNGHILLMSGSVGAVEAVLEIVPTLPINGPPTVILLQIEPGLIPPLIDRLGAQSQTRILTAADDQILESGFVYLVVNPARHAIIDQAKPPRLRLVDGEPVEGKRPSANFLLATAAKTLGPRAVGVLLSGLGSDGAKGLALLQAAGARTACQDSATSIVHGAVEAARLRSAADVELPLEQIGPWALASCGCGVPVNINIPSDLGAASRPTA